MGVMVKNKKEGGNRKCPAPKNLVIDNVYNTIGTQNCEIIFEHCARI